MAFMMGNVYSDAMLVDTQLNVILPQDGRRYIWNEPPKTLILLHGLSDNASTWFRKTAIERYAERYNLAVLIPEVQRSWYCDMVYGQRTFTYITEELPALAEKLFHLSVEPKDLLIAGLSMGGYGALKCAFKNPGRFGYCGAFSGAYNMKELFDFSKHNDSPSVLRGLEKDFAASFGTDYLPEDESAVIDMLKNACQTPSTTKLYMVCGMEDFLYPESCKIREACEKLPIDFTYEEWNGIHEWDVWDKAIERMLKLYLGEERKEV